MRGTRRNAALLLGQPIERLGTNIALEQAQAEIAATGTPHADVGTLLLHVALSQSTVAGQDRDFIAGIQMLLCDFQLGFEVP